MAQTEAGQAKASRKLVEGTIGSMRKNERAVGKAVAKPQPVGSTSPNIAALRKAKFKTHAGV